MRWCVKMSFAKKQGPLTYNNCVAKIFKPNQMSLQQVFSPHYSCLVSVPRSLLSFRPQGFACAYSNECMCLCLVFVD